MEINKIFSLNLKRIRKSKGFSQRDLANTTNLTQRIINYYENNPKSIPIDKLRILSNALNAKISDFFNENGTSNIFDDIDIRWLKKIREIKNLPESDIKEINRHINTILEKNSLKKKK